MLHPQSEWRRNGENASAQGVETALRRSINTGKGGGKNVFITIEKGLSLEGGNPQKGGWQPT